MKTVLRAVLAHAVLCVCWAHLCMISPPQRGSMQGLNKPGAADCILLKGPCGGREQGRTGIALIGGEQFAMTLQKNLDHFNKADPGYLSLSIGERPESMKEIWRQADSSDPSLTLYSANITMPIRPGHMILQAQYVTKNSAAPAVFYQCADVHIVPHH